MKLFIVIYKIVITIHMILGGEVIWLFLDLISELPSPSLCLKEAQPTRQQVDLNLELPSPSLCLEKRNLQGSRLSEWYSTRACPHTGLACTLYLRGSNLLRAPSLICPGTARNQLTWCTAGRLRERTWCLEL